MSEVYSQVIWEKINFEFEVCQNKSQVIGTSPSKVGSCLEWLKTWLRLTSNKSQVILGQSELSLKSNIIQDKSNSILQVIACLSSLSNLRQIQVKSQVIQKYDKTVRASHKSSRAIPRQDAGFSCLPMLAIEKVITNSFHTEAWWLNIKCGYASPPHPPMRLWSFCFQVSRHVLSLFHGFSRQLCVWKCICV